MADSSNGGQHNRVRPPRAPAWARRTRDRRLCQESWIPAYLPDYTEQVGPVAIVLYMLLSRACVPRWEPRWPSVAQLGAMIGVSRSTAERALRALRVVGLIETEACCDEAGQHSNYWDLTDPFDLRGKLDSPGTPDAGAVTPDGAPPSPLTGGDVIPDGGAPSPLTAPPLRSEGSKSVCVEEGTHTPCAAPTSEEDTGAATRIAARWCAHLPPGAPNWQSAQRAEIAWEAAELLRLGWTEGQLLASIEEPARDRREWPREWAGRHGVEVLKAANRPAEAARARHSHAQTLEQGRSEVARRLAMKAEFDRLSSERQGEILAGLVAERPELKARPGILRMLAEDVAAAEGGQLGAAAGQ